MGLGFCSRYHPLHSLIPGEMIDVIHVCELSFFVLLNACFLYLSFLVCNDRN